MFVQTGLICADFLLLVVAVAVLALDEFGCCSFLCLFSVTNVHCSAAM
jgi:hypothetical protein